MKRIIAVFVMAFVCIAKGQIPYINLINVPPSNTWSPQWAANSWSQQTAQTNLGLAGFVTNGMAGVHFDNSAISSDGMGDWSAQEVTATLYFGNLVGSFGGFPSSSFLLTNGNGGGLTGLNGTNLVGSITNSTSGNAATATTATTANNSTNLGGIPWPNYALLSQVVTNWSPLVPFWKRLVAPSIAYIVTNYPPITAAQVSNSFNIFTRDVLGSNFVTMAENSYQVNSNYPSSKQQVMGGDIEVIGECYFHGPLVLTNRSGIFNLTIESPSFCGGWLISDTNPCITTAMDHFRGLAVDIHDLGISSTVNQPTNLVQIYIVDSLLFTHNMLGPWIALTNNTQLVSGPWLNGLITPSDGISARNNINVKHNLVCEFQNGGETDEYIVENNYFMWMAGVFWNPDHGAWLNNKIYHSGAVATNSDWDQGNSLWIGATMVIGQSINNDWVFNHTFFYDDTAGYMLSDSGGLWKTYNDKYESTPLSQIQLSYDDGVSYEYIYQFDVNGAPQNSGWANYDDQGDQSIFDTPDSGTDGSGFPVKNISAVFPSYIGGLYGNQFIAPQGITFTGNGQNLSNLLASQLIGNHQLPQAVMPLIASFTNASIGALTSTNGILFPTNSLIPTVTAGANVATVWIVTNPPNQLKLSSRQWVVSYVYSASPAANNVDFTLTYATPLLYPEMPLFENCAATNTGVGEATGDAYISVPYDAVSTNGFTVRHGGNITTIANTTNSIYFYLP